MAPVVLNVGQCGFDHGNISRVLTELGARPWQIEQTAQVIAEAFVESGQPSAEASESAS